MTATSCQVVGCDAAASEDIRAGFIRKDGSFDVEFSVCDKHFAMWMGERNRVKAAFSFGSIGNPLSGFLRRKLPGEVGHPSDQRRQ